VGNCILPLNARKRESIFPGLTVQLSVVNAHTETAVLFDLHDRGHIGAATLSIYLGLLLICSLISS